MRHDPRQGQGVVGNGCLAHPLIISMFNPEQMTFMPEIVSPPPQTTDSVRQDLLPPSSTISTKQTAKLMNAAAH